MNLNTKNVETTEVEEECGQPIRQDVLDALLGGASMLAPSTIVITELEVSQGVPQGEKRIQYLGRERPEGLVEATEFQSVTLAEIGGSSHVIKLTPDIKLFLPEVSHPLIDLYAYVANGGELLIQHHEHAHLRFLQSGYYAIRNDRSPGVADSAVAQSIVRRVD